MNDPTPGQDAAARYAALVALKAGIDAAVDKARDAALEAAKGMRSASWETPYGPVNVAQRAGSVRLNPDRFMAFVQEHYPDEIVETVVRTVNPALVASFEHDIVVVAGQVVYKPTGAVVEFADIIPPGNPYVAYPASTAQRDAKALATMLVEDSVETLTGRLREVTA